MKHCSIFGLIVVTLLAVGAVADEAAIAVKLSCINQEFKGEAVLVTSLDEPVEFYCEILDEIKAPDGYRASLPEFIWKTDSGTLTPAGASCSWSGPVYGLRTVSVEGKVTLTPLSKGGFFSSAPPEKTLAFSASIQCLIPRKVEKIVDGKIGDFTIGIYPDPNDPEDVKKASSPDTIRRNVESYLPPTLFYEVNPHTYHLKVFNEYTLGEFDLDPRFSNLRYPRYIALSPNLLRKLDLLEKVMRNAGVTVSKFKLIYGFRSPYYNQFERQDDGDNTLKSPFSMHMYGKAADFIVDEDDDLLLDDLNGDGKTTIDDAKYMQEFVDKLDHQFKASQPEMVGGAFLYYHHDYYERGDFAQSPYIHIDVRGYTRPDGSLIRGIYSDKIGVLKKANPYHLSKPVPPFQF